ncbi:hypothetical protein HPC50_18160 [Corallococcus exiguus]|uniref:hypothetical protein n=1 Tax=Corallococcus TaxID=83461 RepID=UPI0011C484E9|nr:MULTISPECIES: hypothetical protein [Corallococcus]NPC48988.1 hypothetical protein [Corallococcus exiguus]
MSKTQALIRMVAPISSGLNGWLIVQEHPMPSSLPLIGLIGLGFEPKLDDLLGELSTGALSALLKHPVKSWKAARQHVATLGADECTRLLLIVQRLVTGCRIDKELLEDIARTHSIPYLKATPADVIVFHLVERLGISSVDPIIEQALRPGLIEFSGTFGSFTAPKIELEKVEPNEFGTALEKHLQAMLSGSKKEDRQVKVRIERVKGGLLVVVYYERPNKDGREITAKKQLRIASFKRGAGWTYFRLSPDKKGTLLTQRTPGQKLAIGVRRALGAVLWGNPDAIPISAAHKYNLDVFKDPGFLMPAVSIPGFNVTGVRLRQIEVLSANGNLLKVTATTDAQDALSDFRRLSREAKAFTKEVEVKTVEVRISYLSDNGRTKVAKAMLKPGAIHMHEEHFLLMESHLHAWGITDATGG